MKKNLLFILVMLCLYSSSNAQKLSGSGNKAYILNATGDVSPIYMGIGTSNPTNKLSIEGDEATFDREFIRLFNTNTGFNSAVGLKMIASNETNVYGSISFNGSTYTNAPDADQAFNISTNGKSLNLFSGGTIRFKLLKNTGVEEPMRIINNGNIGINILNPTAKLHTVGTVKMQSLNTGSSFILTNDADGNVLKSTTSLTDLNATIASLLDRLTIAETEIATLKKKVGVNTPIIQQRTVLFQNEPNPATEITKIKFYLAELSHKVNIFITDINGRMVQQFELNDVSDNQEIVVNANELQAGMYFYTLFINGKETDTKKMFITK